MARILLAPDSFKGSASSELVADAVGRGWLTVRPLDEVSSLPFGDGGEGTLECVERAVGSAKRMPVQAQGADGGERDTWWLLVGGDTAVIEMAMICGITTLSPLNPMAAHSYGLGQVISAAMANAEVREILIAVGGSASTDAGVGALMALGYRFLDHDGREVGLGGGALAKIARIISPTELQLPERGVRILVDVQSPMTGLTGAAHIFAPQKGADKEQVEELDQGLQNFLTVTGARDADGYGAAGGVSGGLAILLGAEIVSGVETLAKLSGIAEQLDRADCLVTGEGAFDSQSFSGKVVGYLLAQAEPRALPALVICGVNKNPVSDSVVSLVELAPSVDEAIKNPTLWLERGGALLAERFTASTQR